MANVIVFTQAIRDAIRGKSDRDQFSEIEPVLMTDGRYYVGVEVLGDVAYSAPKYANLKNVQVVDFETIRHLTFTLVRGVAPTVRGRR
jgi:hypothetical protein